jgi:hypothetical protein
LQGIDLMGEGVQLLVVTRRLLHLTTAGVTVGCEFGCKPLLDPITPISWLTSN